MPLPSFLIVGVPRAGTTTLAGYLSSHPQLFMSAEKELHYFSLRFDRGLEWYEDQFRGSDSAIHVGEATPSYLMNPVAVERMHRTVPDARLIVVLRDPVERAYSHYCFNRSRGIEPLSFEAALEEESARLAADPRDTRFAYCRMGEYAQQLTHLRTLYPEKQIRIVFFEDLKTDSEKVVRGLLRFLEVTEEVPAISRTHRNHFGPPRSVAVARLARALPGPVSRALRRLNTKSADHPPMKAETREHLEARFARLNRDLPALLGAQPSWGSH